MSGKMFAESANQALAMLYMQSQDLSGKTPSEIYQMYREAYDEICETESNHLRAQRDSANSYE